MEVFQSDSSRAANTRRALTRQLGLSESSGLPAILPGAPSIADQGGPDDRP
jgi:hypothetical protein